jgi:type I restriction enzyme R subunit
VQNPAIGETYPKSLDSPGKRALFDNLGKNEALALSVDESIRASRQDDWRNNPFKIKRVRLAIKSVLDGDETLIEKTLELVKNQNEY